MAKKRSDMTPVVWATLRISLGLIFLWAFFDKLLGLGFTTCRNVETGMVDTLCGQAWVNGGSPTTGFLKFATKGPFADFYQGLAGLAWIDWLFMVGLLLIGVALIAGIAHKLATISASIMLIMMWTAALWPEHHPFLDDHLVYVLVLWGIYLNRDKTAWSLNNWWRQQSVVKKFPFLA